MPAILLLPIPALALLVVAGCWAAAAVCYLAVNRLAGGEWARAFKAISPGMLPPLAIVFAFLVGFLAAQVWNDAAQANAAVIREAGALRSAVLLAAEFPREASTQLETLVHRHVEAAVREEWPAMARGEASLALVPAALAEALHLAVSLEPKTAGQTVAQRELVAAIQNGLDARRQRIVLSGVSVNGVKWGVLLAQLVLVLLTIAMVHADNPRANRVILAIFATGAAAAILLIAAHSRPFAGAISVRPALLLQVAPGMPGAR